MRLRSPGGTTIHLAYCTNVHPAEELPGILEQLDRFAVPVRDRLAADVLGLGLWLAAPVAAELAADPAARRRLRDELGQRRLEVVTFNGFPYQAFHAPVVKHAVYHPDWAAADRLRYTLDLATVLADLLPDDAARGSISTVPFGWREAWTAEHSEVADRQLDELGRGLARLRDRTGRQIRVAIEPESGCLVETTEQAIRWLSAVDPEHVGLCMDLAHLACAWEEPADAVARLRAAGIPIVKAQVSAALEVADPRGAAEVLAGYIEPRFLHQTRSATGAAFDDLPDALAAGPDGPWRIHFHVPLHAAPAAPLQSTTGVLRAGLAALLAGTEPCEHLEVETYTWTVLPADRRPVDDAGLADGIAGELEFTAAELVALGLTPITTTGAIR
ncbi:MAG: metabolite traffic protein EboE [Sporichthyaceae bacterium]|nr:metabolite traffic protein EboE [Sporichthyaceae bacterium]